MNRPGYGLAMNGQLYDCIAKVAEEAEILLLGSEWMEAWAKADRDRFSQACLPIEPDFVFVDVFAEAIDSEVVLAIVSALGAGILLPEYGLEFVQIAFDLSKLRYAKVILVTEDSEAGDRVRDEVIRFMSFYLRPLVEAGHLYVPVGPIGVGMGQEEFEARILNKETREIRVVDVPPF